MCQDFLVAHWCQKYDSRSWCGLDFLKKLLLLFSTTTVFSSFSARGDIACMREGRSGGVFVICLCPNQGGESTLRLHIYPTGWRLLLPLA